MIRLILADLREYFTLFIVMVFLISATLALSLTTMLQERALRLGSAAAADKFDIVIGAKGSPAGLVLSSVFLRPSLLDLMEPETLEKLKNDERIQWVSPIGMGDYYDKMPIVGVFEEMLSGEIASGRMFENSFEAVAGSKSGLKIGDEFTPVHGLVAMPNDHSHDHIKYRVVGIKKSDNTIWDKAILVSINSVWEIHAHHDHGEHAHGENGHSHSDHSHAEHDHAHDGDHGHSHGDRSHAHDEHDDSHAHDETHKNSENLDEISDEILVVDASVFEENYPNPHEQGHDHNHDHGHSHGDHSHGHSDHSHADHSHDETHGDHFHDGDGHEHHSHDETHGDGHDETHGDGDHSHSHDSDHAHAHHHDQGVPAIVVKPKSIAAAYQIREEYTNESTIAVFPAEILVQIYSILGDVKAWLLAISIALQTLMAFMVLAISFVFIAQKKAQISEFRVFGADRKRVMFFVWLELFLIILVGIVLGTIFGYVLAHFISYKLGLELGFALVVSFSLEDLYFIGAMLLLGVIISLIPLYKIYKLSVISSLRG